MSTGLEESREKDVSQEKEPEPSSQPKVRKTCGALKSYIQQFSDGKWVLLVNCTEAMAQRSGKNRKDVINFLWPHAKKIQ